MFKKLSLELGGKNPNIVFADANFEKAVALAVKAGFSNQGQICLCGSRLFVEETIYEKFKNAVIAKASLLKVGNPKESNDLGAVVSIDHMNKVLSNLPKLILFFNNTINDIHMNTSPFYGDSDVQ